MTRILAALLVVPFLTGAAAAQHAEVSDRTDAVETDAVEIVPLDCIAAGEGIACTVETEAPVTFCMAVDADGAPLANSTGASDAGAILFQDVDASQIAALRCRPV